MVPFVKAIIIVPQIDIKCNNGVFRDMYCAKVTIVFAFFIEFVDFAPILFTFFKKSDKIN